MRVLFVGSNPDDASTLNLEREITELQKNFGEVAGEAVNFRFLPAIPLEELPGELIKYRPNILHISAHGSVESLSLARVDKVSVEISADALASFFDGEHKPQLVYINACNSRTLAKRLTDLGIAFAIGSTADITNRAARAAAVVFYNRILSGHSVERSFEASKAMVEAIDKKNVKIEIFPSSGSDPANTYFYKIPRLIADFALGFPEKRSNEYEVRFGLIGCPSNTVQVIFFTDDSSFISSQESISDDLCAVVRTIPTRGTVWMEEIQTWSVEGDFRLFAVGSLGDGSAFSVGSTLCDAIEARYRWGPDGQVPPDIAEAVRDLRRENAADLEHHPERQKKITAAAKRAKPNKPNIINDTKDKKHDNF